MSKARRVDPASSLAGYAGAFAMVLSAGFMTLLDVSIVNVALPSMEQSLGAGPTQIQWIVAGYALAFGLTLVAAGRAGDILGRKKLFLFGLTAFVLTSLACGLAPNAYWLAGMRFAQGASAGILNPQVIGLIQDFYKGKALARAFGIFGVVVGLSTALGPVLGGLLIALAGPDLGWRLVFLMNVPIGLVVVPLAAKKLPRSARRPLTQSSLIREFDPVGILLLGGATLLVMLPFLEPAGSSTNARSYHLLIPAVLLIGLFALWEWFWIRQGGTALGDPELLKNWSFLLGVLAAFFYFGGFTSIFLIVTLYLQQGVGWTALAAGAAAVPFAVASGVTSGASGGLVNRFGRVIPVVGSGIVALTMAALGLLLLEVPPAWGPWAVIAAMALAGAGSGLMISPNQALALQSVTNRLAGVAAALMQTFQRLGTAIGLSFVTTVYFGTVAANREHGPQEAGQAALSLSSFAIAGIVFLAVAVGFADWVRVKRDKGSTKETVASVSKGQSASRGQSTSKG